jgi:competence protein ComEA
MKFTKSQLRGLWILGTLLILSEGFRLGLRINANHRPPPPSSIIWLHEGPEVALNLSSEGAALTPFNPNKLDLEGWILLGLSEKQAGVMMRYNRSGEAFRKPEDLQKIHVISEVFFNKIEPFLRFDDAPLSRDLTRETRPQPAAVFDSLLQALGTTAQDSISVMTNEFLSDAQKAFLWQRLQRKSLDSVLSQPIDINQADSAILAHVPGIGSHLAGRIVQYRMALGGYLQLAQLPDLLGLDSTRWTQMQPRLKLGKAPQPNWIFVNADDLKTLQAHPLLNYRNARDIVQFRERYRTFTAFDELEKLESIDADLLRKIAPYLKFDLFKN